MTAKCVDNRELKQQQRRATATATKTSLENKHLDARRKQ